MTLGLPSRVAIRYLKCQMGVRFERDVRVPENSTHHVETITVYHGRPNVLNCTILYALRCRPDTGGVKVCK